MGLAVRQDALDTRAGEHQLVQADVAHIARLYVRTGVDWVTVAWTGSGLGIIAASTWAAWTGLVPLWAGVMLNAYFMFFIFATMHEASHGNIGHGRSAWLNPTLGWLCGLVNLVPYRGWGDLHAWHHSHVNDPARDPDAWVEGKNPFKVVFRAATIPPHYVHFYFQTQAHKELRGGYFSLVTILLNWTVALSAGFTFLALGYGYELLLLWPLAAYLSIFLMGMMFVWFPHYPKNGRGRDDNSTVYAFKGLGRWLMPIFDLGQSYHLIHHAFPTVPFYRQAALFRQIRPFAEARGSRIIDL